MKEDRILVASKPVAEAVAARCSRIADEIVPEYRDGKRSYSCTSPTAKRWQAAWDGACTALGHSPENYRRPREHSALCKLLDSPARRRGMPFVCICGKEKA